jgi:acyl dehydratase
MHDEASMPAAPQPPLPADVRPTHWEDFAPGLVIELGQRRIERDEIIEFASRYDPQRFHLDEQAAAASIFGGLCASGWHTVATMMRLMCDRYLLGSASQGSPGVDKLRWKAPLRPGDTLSGRMIVLEARPMASKPHIGLVNCRWEGINQHGVLVVELEGWGMFLRRAPGTPAPWEAAAAG